MASYTAYRAIRDYLAAEWTTTPLAWENESFDAAELTPWVRAEVTSSSFQQESIGAGEITANRWVEVGSLFMMVMVPSGTGTDLARSYADTLTNLFRGLDLIDFEFTRISIGLGRVSSEDGNWWQLPTEVEWERG